MHRREQRSVSNTPTIANSQGTPQPNPAYFGFKRGAWGDLQRLLDEGAKLRTEAKKGYAEWQASGEDIKRLEAELREQRAAALRGGPEPDQAALEKVKERREALNDRMQDYRRAGQLIDSDIQQLLFLNRDAWDLEVQAKAEKVLAEAAAISAALAAKLSETDHLVGVHSWLTSGGVSYTPATPAAISLESVLYERRRDLGLLDAGVLG